MSGSPRRDAGRAARSRATPELDLGSRYRLLLEGAYDAILFVGPDDGYLDVNAKATELLGYGREELLSMSIRDVYFPEGWEEARERLEALRRGEPQRWESTMRRKDGTPVEIEGTATLLPDGIVQSIVRDVTARKAAERALRESEARFRAVFEGAAIGMAIAGLDGCLQESNGAFAEMLGLPLHELRGKRIAEFTHPDDVEEHLGLFESLRTGRLDYYEHEKRYVGGDGSIVWARLAGSLVRGADGEPAFTIGMIEDISGPKRAREALRESELRFRAIFESALVAMILVDDEGRIGEANPAAAALFERSHEELIGRSVLDGSLTAPEELERLPRLWEELLAGGRHAGEVEVVRPDGSRRQVECSARARALPEAHLLLLQDVTERRSLEEQLLQAQKLEAIGRLAGGIAHDFNNLLTTVTGYSELLLGRLEPTDPSRHELEQIRRAAEAATELTSQLLAYSRRQVLRLEAVDLGEVVRTLEPMLRRMIGEDVELVAALGPEVPPVQADPSRLEQVLVNLVVNARDAMPRGGTVTVRTVAVEVGPEEAAERSVEPGAFSCLSVEDTGVGIDPEYVSLVFEPFFTTKGQAEGTGLGLSTVHGVVAQSGGFVRVESTPGVGSAFSVYLPRADAPSALSPAPVPAPAAEATGNETVLLVEDEPAVRALIEELLRERGYRVLAPADVAGAIDLADAHDGPIDLLLVDVVMPRLSGPELAARVRRLRPGLEVVYMSGYSEDLAVGSDLPPQALFLQKPFGLDELAAVVRQALDGR